MIVLEIDSSKCKGCGLCIGVCPKKILCLSEDVKSNGLYSIMTKNEEDCIGCKNCATMCPDSAISILKD